MLSDLEAHGLDVNQLRDVLCGGHVLVDNPELYERWRFPKVTRQRLSSHHKTVDKQTYPDLGMHGPLVREKLHGRTANGTWVQLEKTPAAFGKGHRLPSWNDVLHHGGLRRLSRNQTQRRAVGALGGHRTAPDVSLAAAQYLSAAAAKHATSGYPARSPGWMPRTRSSMTQPIRTSSAGFPGRCARTPWST